jgi:hypothetical protein
MLRAAYTMPGPAMKTASAIALPPAHHQLQLLSLLLYHVKLKIFYVGVGLK